MYYQVISGIVLGVEGSLVRVEVDASNGMPYFSMVGYLSSEVKEAKDRVISALRSVLFHCRQKELRLIYLPRISEKRVLLSTFRSQLRFSGVSNFSQFNN